MTEVYPSDIDIELEFSTGVWTDVSEDIRTTDPLIAKYGIRGVGPLERLGHAGTWDFALDNSSENSGAAQGYYSPGHSNVRSGFGIGIGSRVKITYGGTDYYKWRGRLKNLRPEAGSKGLQVTHVNSQDWLAAASEIKPLLLEVQENKDGGALITALLAAIDDDPAATDLDTGISTFSYTWDDVRDGNTTVYEILRGIAISELGYIIQIGDTSQGGTLQFENRHARVKESSILVTMDDDGDGDDLRSLEVEDVLGNVYNVIRAEAYPRVIDATANQVLWSLQGDAPTINPGEQIEITGKYTDPDQRVSRVAGIEIQDPEGRNLISNRGFEVDTSGWAATSAPADGSEAVDQSSDYAKKGTYSAKLTTGTNAATDYFIYKTEAITGLAQNDVLYYQFYIYIPDAWPEDIDIIFQEQTGAGAYINNEGVAALDKANTGQWVRIAGTHTVVDATTEQIVVYIGNLTVGDFSGGAVTLYLDECYVIHDSELNYASSGAEEDLELIDSEMGGNSSKFIVKNLGSASITLDTLQVIGKRALIYQPALATAEDATSKTTYGERPLSMGLLYQDDPLEAQDFADITKSRWKDATLRAKSVTFWANRSDTLMTAFLQGEPGKRISISETVTGIDGEYFINGVEFQIIPPLSAANILVTWHLAEAGNENYWILGTSQLGSETVLGF